MSPAEALVRLPLFRYIRTAPAATRFNSQQRIEAVRSNPICTICHTPEGLSSSNPPTKSSLPAELSG